MERDATQSWRHSVAIPALGSAALLWLSFRPIGWSALAWLAPVGWLWLVRQPEWKSRRSYLWLYGSGTLFWLAELQGIRLAHWALYFGWLALALCLAAFTPLFVGLARVLVHRWRVPLPLAGAVAWTACEYARAHFATGFTGCLLAHSQANSPSLIQAAAWGGPYAVSMIMLLAAGCAVEAAQTLVVGETRRWPLAAAWAVASLMVPAIVWERGSHEVRQRQQAADRQAEDRAGLLQLALIQDSVDTIFEYNPERSRDTFAKYRNATLAACREHPGLDLVVWPESVFTENSPDLLGGNPSHPELARLRAEFDDKVAWLARDVNVGRTDFSNDAGTWLLVGTVTVDLNEAPPRERNSALLISPQGRVVKRYFKNHLVMFGEYIPLGDWFPWLYQLTPMPGGLKPGDGPEPIDLHGVRLSPSICFESMVPHLIARHERVQRQAGKSPDALVNVTNDGWFWGSGILDLHLQAAVFRAVEHRRPLFVAANTGFSCWVDAEGLIRAQAERRQPAVIFATVGPTDEQTVYQRFGDLLAGACLIVGTGAVGLAFISRRCFGRSLTAARPSK